MLTKCCKIKKIIKNAKNDPFPPKYLGREVLKFYKSIISEAAFNFPQFCINIILFGQPIDEVFPKNHLNFIFIFCKFDAKLHIAFSFVEQLSILVINDHSIILPLFVKTFEIEFRFGVVLGFDFETFQIAAKHFSLN